jgi:hypothetical protein
VDRASAVDGRGDALGQNACPHDGALCRSAQLRAGSGIGSRHRAGHRGSGARRSRAVAARSGRIQSVILSNPAHPLSASHAGPG